MRGRSESATAEICTSIGASTLALWLPYHSLARGDVDDLTQTEGLVKTRRYAALVGKSWSAPEPNRGSALHAMLGAHLGAMLGTTLRAMPGAHLGAILGATAGETLVATARATL